LSEPEGAARWHQWLGRYEHIRTLSELNGLLQELRASPLASSPRVQWLARRCVALQKPGALKAWDGVHHLGEK
jgi:hypothetical protein